MQHVATQGAQRINALHDTAGITGDVSFQQSSGKQHKSHRVPYVAPTSMSDRTMMKGEIAVARSKGWVPGTQDNPHVRTVLNGMTVKSVLSDTDVMKNPESLLAEMKKSVRMVGVMLKTVEYDASRIDLDPSDDPVVLVSGHITVTNTGQHSIESGNAMQAYFVPTDTINQYNDKVNFFSPNRVVLGMKPLIMEQEMRKELLANDKNLEKAFYDAFKAIAASPAVEAELMAKLTALTSLTAIDAPLLCDATLHAARANTMWQMHKFVGVATTGGEAGHRFNLLSHPITNLVSRSRTGV